MTVDIHIILLLQLLLSSLVWPYSYHYGIVIRLFLFLFLLLLLPSFIILRYVCTLVYVIISLDYCSSMISHYFSSPVLSCLVPSSHSQFSLISYYIISCHILLLEWKDSSQLGRSVWSHRSGKATAGYRSQYRICWWCKSKYEHILKCTILYCTHY